MPRERTVNPFPLQVIINLFISGYNSMINIFATSELTILLCLGLPTAIYMFVAHRSKREHIEQLSETIANYSLFNSLYAVFLSMALVTLMVNYYAVQDDTSSEGQSIVSAMRLACGLSEAEAFKQSLVSYAKSVVEYDVKAMEKGKMSNEASVAFDDLWNKLYSIKLTTKNDETILRTLVGELNEITKCRMVRRIKSKNILHPMIFVLIITGYYIMLIKTYFTRVANKKSQLLFELSMFTMIMLVAVVIVDLNTPFIGFVNIDTSAFNWAFERVSSIYGAHP